MAEILKTRYYNLLNETIVSDHDFEAIVSQRLKEIPENLNVVNQNFKSFYYSYATFDEVCPEDCPGPVGYCPNFLRKKPITVSDFVKTLFSFSTSEYQPVFFESTQIIPGLGGIESCNLKDGLEKIMQTLQNPKLVKKIIISTTCNCHGVSSVYTLLH